MVKVIISGGGTGGHIFPAIAIANAIKAKVSDAEILFVGAQGRMEMEKVPAAGYPIKGLWISGLQRRLTWKNMTFPFKVIASLIKASNIISSFKPDIVIGVGGYASGPILRIAVRNKIPTLIQEQNSYPGITNKMLGMRVNRICVAYEGMDKFFPAKKILLTGNPVRRDILSSADKKEESIAHFGLKPDKKTILVIGGSLGAGKVNESILKCIHENLTGEGVQVIWQTGKFYFDRITEDTTITNNPDVHVLPFIESMALAFAAADIVISRAGAIAISELCIVGKPVILIPSPNVAEDHQTKNAQALERKKAAIMLKDKDAVNQLFPTLSRLIKDESLQVSMHQNIIKLAIPDAADKIADEVIKLIKRNSS
ncbi:MAG: undecaprenyldiphospho-muramoylpentapeptide beta-N-acetylglucosaminyltransferase [Bacteroidetes bacterium]|nr:undecaprenyldiphospho-muramoylpentapeptide beta-N-acetylglucosaminyltransferase [Bacteroidota bacterium]